MDSDIWFQNEIKGLQTEQNLWNFMCETWKNILIKYCREYHKIAMQQFNLMGKKNRDSFDNQEWYSGVWCAFYPPCQVNNMSLRQKEKKFQEMLFVFQGLGEFHCRKQDGVSPLKCLFKDLYVWPIVWLWVWYGSKSNANVYQIISKRLPQPSM